MGCCRTGRVRAELESGAAISCGLSASGGRPSVDWRSRWTRRLVGLATWAAPVAALALIPKCPACIAGYVLLLTGVGPSVPAAAGVRWALVAVCALGLVYLVLRAVRRAFIRRA